MVDIVVKELIECDYSHININNIRDLNPEEIEKFIRWRLSYNDKGIEYESIDSVEYDGVEYELTDGYKYRVGRKFNMSGYDHGTDNYDVNNVGRCVVDNINILNIFADLGIYDYVYLLWLDFFQGCGSLTIKYYDDITQEKSIIFKDCCVDNIYVLDSPTSNSMVDISVSGYTTTEIIHLILQLTTLNNVGLIKRRRIN